MRYSNFAFHFETYDDGSNFAPPGFSALHAGAGLWISVANFGKWMQYSMAEWSVLVTTTMQSAIGALYNTCYPIGSDGASGTQYNLTTGQSTPVSSTSATQQHRQGNAWTWDGHHDESTPTSSPPPARSTQATLLTFLEVDCGSVGLDFHGF